MALDFSCGWECRINVVGAAASPSANHWHTVTGTTAINTTTVRTGTASLQCNPVAATGFHGRTVARTIVAGRFYFHVVTMPAAQAAIFSNEAGASDGNIRLENTGQLNIRVGLGTAVNLDSPISTGTWYRIDYLYDTSGGTRSLKVRLDGGTEAEATEVVVSTNIVSVRAGIITGGSTADILYDDLVLGGATGDYPIGAGTVERLRPNEDGTHSFTAGNFGYDSAGADVATSATDVWTYVDDVDLTSITDGLFIRQKTARAAGYVEVGFEAPVSTSDAQCVTCVSSWHASATGANTVGLKYNDGGTILAITDPAGDALSDFSNTTVTFDSATSVTAPSGGAWTNAKLVAIKVRMGYSGDVVGIPYWDGVMLEVAFPEAVAATRVPYVNSMPQLLAH